MAYPYLTSLAAAAISSNELAAGCCREEAC
jgi:hypothetical protein